ncbi:cytochrome b/b6 domain-containing protein [Methyloferula stellata]|uniref:cytochrome b/b6 domain-containing protein n=1 Tax=Methyloferula stellata TaxID=876270 RepID=UPI0003601AAE|nr:cytochrome b/b6 domain-containing protein [Methyloferula stellata]
MTVSDHYTEVDAFDGQRVETPAAGQSKVWDLPVRLFHWTLVVAFVGAFVTNRLGVSYFKYHIWFGYTVIVLVSFRLLWGFVGTYHAQFHNFLRGPVATLHYAVRLVRGRASSHLGHNPLGAWMVVFLLIGLGVQAVTGLFGNDDIFNIGPLAGYVTKDMSLRLTSLHRHSFYWIAAAIAVHVLAVVAHRIFDQSDLVRAMFTGRKRRSSAADAGDISSSRTWLAFLLTVTIAGALAFVVTHAPIAVDDTF